MPGQEDKTLTLEPKFIPCPACDTDNRVKAKACKKCGYDLSLPPLWMPTWKWHLKVLGIIYVILIAAYFIIDALLSQLPPPLDLRDLPLEITPWLKK